MVTVWVQLRHGKVTPEPAIFSQHDNWDVKNCESTFENLHAGRISVLSDLLDPV